MYKALPLGEKYFLPKSGHVSMIDEPKLMNDVIADFFDRVEESLSSTTNSFVPQQPASETYCSINSISDEEEELEKIELIPDTEVSEMDDFSTLSLNELETKLHEAVNNEDYELAAKIRDEIDKRS